MTAKKRAPKGAMRTSLGDATRERIAWEVFGLMREGLPTVRACKRLGTPAATFVRWMGEDAALAELYARAREDLMDHIAAEILEIADAPVGMTASGSTDTGAVNKQRLQVDTRKWLLSKLAPKKYGDRIDHTSSDGSMKPQAPTIITLCAPDADE